MHHSPELHPGGDQHGQLHGGELQAVGAIVEVALVELLVIQLLDAVKAGVAEFGFHRFRRKEQLERLSGGGDTGSQRVEGGAADGAERLRREAVVEAYGAALRELGYCAQGGAKGRDRQVRHYSQPAEECGRLQIEARLGQLPGQRVMLKVQRHEGEIGGQRDLGFGEHGLLPLLGGGKIDFEDVQRGKWIAIGKGVEPGAENHVLSYAQRHCFGKLVFNIAAAHGHEGAKVAGDAVTGALHLAGMGGPDQADCYWIVEDRRMVHQLMRGAANGHTESGLAGAASLHEFKFRGVRPAHQPRTIIPMSWIGWALLSAVFAAATALLAKVGVAHVDSNLATALRTSVVVVFAWGIALALSRPGMSLLGEIRALDRRTLLFLTLSGLATGLSWLCYFRALQLGPASRVAPLDKLSVPLVIVFAWLLLGEKLTPPAIAGGVLITAGAVVIALG